MLNDLMNLAIESVDASDLEFKHDKNGKLMATTHNKTVRLERVLVPGTEGKGYARATVSICVNYLGISNGAAPEEKTARATLQPQSVETQKALLADLLAK